MKLTKDDLHIINLNAHEDKYGIYFRSLEGNTIEWTKEEGLEVVRQILKNQEDAKKYKKIVMQGTLPLVEVTNALEIVERLKKRIKKNRKWLIDNDKHGSDLHEWYKQKWLENVELQKILENKE